MWRHIRCIAVDIAAQRCQGKYSGCKAESAVLCCRAESAIIAAILHDVLDDTSVGLDQIEEQFGAEVANMVAKVSQLSSMNQLLRRRRRQLVHHTRSCCVCKSVRTHNTVHEHISASQGRIVSGLDALCGVILPGQDLYEMHAGFAVSYTLQPHALAPLMYLHLHHRNPLLMHAFASQFAHGSRLWPPAVVKTMPDQEQGSIVFVHTFGPMTACRPAVGLLVGPP